MAPMQDLFVLDEVEGGIKLHYIKNVLEFKYIEIFIKFKHMIRRLVIYSFGRLYEELPRLLCRVAF